MAEKELEEFEEMFGLTSTKTDDSDQAEEYGHSTEPDEPFEEIVEEMSNEIKDMKDKGFEMEETKKEAQEIIEEICEKGSDRSEHKDEDDIFDSLPQDDSKQEEDWNNIEEEPEPESEETTSSNLEQETVSNDDKIKWLFKSPSAMYDNFYKAKEKLIFEYMVGGQVEYTRWINELANAEVKIKSEVFDQQITLDQMEEVQQHRERVKYISIRVNNQYYMFKRFIEIMRGFLAKIQYIKPQIKQEGLIFEHMRDLELYYTRLEALHDSALKAEKSLAAAFDTLSRKVSICMELRPVDRYEKKERPVERREERPIIRKEEDNSDLDIFDELPSNASTRPKKLKTGEIGWDEF